MCHVNVYKNNFPIVHIFYVFIDFLRLFMDNNLDDNVKVFFTNNIRIKTVDSERVYFNLTYDFLLFTEETFIRGYRIPKSSVLLLNFWSAHNDPEMFEDPHIFNPSRYFFRENKGRMPVLFGMGKSVI